NVLPVKDASGRYETGECEKPGNENMVPVPGSAGPDNSQADVVCVTGKVVGMSIGYDGDISFDVNDGPSRDSPGPGVAQYTNYHNFLPGPGGSDAPDGIDVEIPPSDQSNYLPQILALRTGFTVRVCGRWVADTHQLWNELHPIVSLDIVNAGGQTP